ncbi:hypothetical protein [Spirosoma sordidisoli]|uniref:Uncharacterized protein n=1 Tax=Spirosoma sordidisoli TaxID=2502893 RepID=A0A4Q2UMM6_9BACT|nr:hypothetical protein [Spirosoma sordidisoli]RYC70032.1 hypothetical protein EQG79_09180 [Spirosoma sordidisoli]
MTQTTSPGLPTHPYSHHIFLFPFRWDYKTRSKAGGPLKNTLFEQRTYLGDIEKLFATHNLYTEGELPFDPHLYWKRFNFNMNRGRDYNEFTYFNEPVRDVIYDPKIPEGEPYDQILLQYDYQFVKASYAITVANKTDADNPSKTYTLSVTDIVLNFYQSGVGIISFHGDNFDHAGLNDILRINESGRRIYPPFLGDHGSAGEVPTQPPQTNNLATSIALTLDNATLTEDFAFYNTGWQSVNNNPERLPRFIHALLGGRFTTTEADTDQLTEYVLVKPIIDDRMFTLCWYSNPDWVGQLTKNQAPLDTDIPVYAYERDADWLSYVFVDPERGGSLANKRLLTQLNRHHTYDRWVEYGTLFGITRYSFVALTGSDFGAKYVLPHIQTMYFQMVMLVLIQRASLLRFAQEATDLASLSPDSNSRLDRNVEGLYEKYLTFINKMYFRDVTAQEQGIELYDRLAEAIELDKEVDITRRNIDELNKYVALKSESGTKRRLSLLTLLVSTFSIPSFLLTYYGMDFIKQGWDNNDSSVERYLEIHKSVPILVVFFLLILNAVFFWKDFRAIGTYTDSRSGSANRRWRLRVPQLLISLIIIILLVALLWPLLIH